MRQKCLMEKYSERGKDSKETTMEEKIRWKGQYLSKEIIVGSYREQFSKGEITYSIEIIIGDKIRGRG